MKPYHIYQYTKEDGKTLYLAFKTKAAAEMALETLERREKQYPKWLRARYTLEEVR